MQLFYQKPSDAQIDKYVEEVVELLVNDHLDSVDYGFRRSDASDAWVVGLRYVVRNGVLLITSQLRAGKDISTDYAAGGILHPLQ